MSETEDLAALLECLSTSGVELIVVGGVAGVLHGADITTSDVDIVHRRTPENVRKLLELLRSLDAEYRNDFHQPRLRPTESNLMGAGMNLLRTKLGLLDVLGAIGEENDPKGYDELIEHTDEVSDGNTRLRVLDVETWIELKMKLGREKDKLAVAAMIAARNEQQKLAGTKP